MTQINELTKKIRFIFQKDSDISIHVPKFLSWQDIHLKIRDEAQTTVKDLYLGNLAREREECNEVKSFLCLQLNSRCYVKTILRLYNEKQYRIFAAQLAEFKNKSTILGWHGCFEADPDVVQIKD